MRVNAVADRDLETLTVCAAIGATGIAGSVDVWALGGNLDDSYTVDDKTDKALVADDGSSYDAGSYGDDAHP